MAKLKLYAYAVLALDGEVLAVCNQLRLANDVVGFCGSRSPQVIAQQLDSYFDYFSSQPEKRVSTPRYMLPEFGVYVVQDARKSGFSACTTLESANSVARLWENDGDNPTVQMFPVNEVTVNGHPQGPIHFAHDGDGWISSVEPARSIPIP